MTRKRVRTSQNDTAGQKYTNTSTAEETSEAASSLRRLTISSQVTPDGSTLAAFAPPVGTPAVVASIFSIKVNGMPVDGMLPSLTERSVEKDHDSVLTGGSTHGEGDSNASISEGKDAPVTGGQRTYPAQEASLSKLEHRASDVDVHRMKIRNVGNKGNSINFVANDFQLEPSARVVVTGDVENVGNGGNSVNYVGNTDGPEGLEAFLKLVALVQGNPMQ